MSDPNPAPMSSPMVRSVVCFFTAATSCLCTSSGSSVSKIPRISSSGMSTERRMGTASARFACPSS